MNGCGARVVVAGPNAHVGARAVIRKDSLSRRSFVALLVVYGQRVRILVADPFEQDRIPPNRHILNLRLARWLLLHEERFAIAASAANMTYKNELQPILVRRYWAHKGCCKWVYVGVHEVSMGIQQWATARIIN